MSKAGYLLKNTGILAIGSFSSKILVFLLVPLYTAVLTTGEYGSYDLILNSINLLLPILTLNISDAVLRFPLDEDADSSHIIHIGLCFTLGSSLVLLAFQFVPGAPWSAIDGIVWLAPLYFSLALYQLLQLFARGMERFTEVAVAGVVSTVATVVLNIVFLLVLGLGLPGFFLANITGQLLPCIYLLVCLRRCIFRKSAKLDPGHALLRSMIRYSLPLAVNTVSWWFVNVSDIYIVAGLCGLDATGQYTIAYKIPAILNVLQSIFLQAWQVSAVIDFDKDDKDGFLRKSYNMVQAATVICCSLLIAFSPLIARFMFSNEFYDGWVYVPFLLIYATLNTMSGILGGFYMAVKDTLNITISVLLGAIVNVCGGFALVILMGPMGAAISSLLAGLTTWLYRARLLKRHMSVGFGILRSLAVYGLLTAQAFLVLAGFPLEATALLQVGFIVAFGALFKTEGAAAIVGAKKALARHREGEPTSRTD